MLDITLPFPPSANRYWRVYQGRVIKSIEARRYQHRVKLLTLNITSSFTKEHRLKVDVDLYPPDKRARDLDNSLKILIDSIQDAKLIENDSQIDELFIKRFEPVKDGKVVVRIQSLGAVGA